MTIRTVDEFEKDIVSFQNLDLSSDWLEHDPEFEWTREDLEEFEREELWRTCEQEALAHWWESEGVRCATFGNPNRNPYK